MKYIILLAFLLLLPIANAVEYYCISNTTLVKNDTLTFCKDDRCKVYSKVEEINCDYGCDPVTQSCSPNPFYKWLILVAIIAVICLIAYAFWRRGGYYFR